MNVIIVGCGKVGATLAANLIEEGNDVTVIDQNAEKVRAVANKYDIMGVIGNGAFRATQMDAGIQNADLLIAVTGTDEINLLSCLVAKKSSNCKTIARLKNPEYNTDAHYFKNELGLAMVVNPEYAAAREIERILNFPSAIKIETFARGRIELLSFKIPERSPISGMTIKDVAVKYRCDLTFCSIEREDEVYIANGSFRFEERDIVSIIASPKSANEFFKKIGYKIQPIKDVLIVGGDEITHYLCEMLDRSGISVKVIEKDAEKCNELAAEFKRATIICGDPADEDTMREEGIETASSFIALTGLDEENILLSLFAKRAGSRKVITKINHIEYDDIVNHLDLDSIVYPKNITADMISRYVRAVGNTNGSSNIETLYNLKKGKMQVLEFVVNENAELLDTPLSMLNFKPDILVAAILRSGVAIIPRGDTLIKSGDTVVIATKNLLINDISDILK